jgi:FMN reductase
MASIGSFFHLPAPSIVAVSGGLQRPPGRHPGRAPAGPDRRRHPSEQHLIELGELAPQLAGALWRSQLPEAVERQLVAVEQADVLVVATPVYRGSYTGLFKHFFDFIDQDALVDTPILLAATGGSERHALVIDHQLRPLFSFFQARTLPLGVYATDRDFAEGRVHNEALIQRARLAVQRACRCWRCPARAAAGGHRSALNAGCPDLHLDVTPQPGTPP